MTVELKDGTRVEDPLLDRLVHFDERSRNFSMQTLVNGKKPKSNDWRIQTPFLIDQGREGACVGFAVTNELQARPAEVVIGDEVATNKFAVERIYHEAQRIDPWPGGSYPDASPKYGGTSVLAGIKVAQKIGYFKEYRWSFGLRDLVLGVAYKGPAVLGISWYETNYNPDGNGYIAPVGNKVGGHAILARAVKVVWREGFLWDIDEWNAVDLDASYLTLRNSWGVWGHNGSGDCYVTLRNMMTWLVDEGEVVFAVSRRTVASMPKPPKA